MRKCAIFLTLKRKKTPITRAFAMKTFLIHSFHSWFLLPYFVSWRFFLQAQNLSERKSAKAIVNMKVKDVSDNVPQFNQRSYIQDAAEAPNDNLASGKL